MADTLRRLANTSSFSVLQDKLESWHKDYHVSSSISNDDRPKSDQTTSSLPCYTMLSLHLATVQKLHLHTLEMYFWSDIFKHNYLSEYKLLCLLLSNCDFFITSSHKKENFRPIIIVVVVMIIVYSVIEGQLFGNGGNN